MDEDAYNELAAQVGIHGATNQNSILANQNSQLQYQLEESEKNLAEAQLDCDSTLVNLRHLLRQDRKVESNNTIDWKPISDPKKRILTDEGVDKIMEIMETYINKETLLSNFGDETIKSRMLEFSLAFSGLIFMKYEIYFRVPTLLECKEILKKRMQEHIDKKVMACELRGKAPNLKEIQEEVGKDFEKRMEYEIGKIKQEQTKLNLREFEMMFIKLKALIEATHNRAWKGEERGSLRRHFNISEVIGGKSNSHPENKSRWSVFSK